jgi:hypothetical protein
MRFQRQFAYLIIGRRIDRVEHSLDDKKRGAAAPRASMGRWMTRLGELSSSSEA